MAASSTRWASPAAAYERPFWKAYATNVHRHNALGQPFIDQARNWFLGADVLRTLAYHTTIFKAPREYRRTSLTPFTVRFHAIRDIITVTFNEADEWHNFRESILILFATAGLPLTTYGKHQPYRYLGHVKGHLASPQNFRPILPLVGGQAFFVRGVALTSSNYMSRSHCTRGVGF